jgi:hypothetical protein
MPGKRNRSVLMSVLLLVGNQGQPDAFVVGILGYAFRFDGLGIEAQAALVDFQNAEFPKNTGEALRGVVAASEEISIPRRR